MGDTRPLVVFDCDGTVGCGTLKHRVRPGIREMILMLRALGYRVHFWSAGGKQWATDVAKCCGLDDLVEAYHSKLPFEQLTQEGVEKKLGVVPVLTVDDDPKEAIPGVPLLHVPGWYGPGAEEFEGWEKWERPPVEARRSGACPRCKKSIRPGDGLQLSRGQWVCAECGADDIQVEVEGVPV